MPIKYNADPHIEVAVLDAPGKVVVGTHYNSLMNRWDVLVVPASQVLEMPVSLTGRGNWIPAKQEQKEDENTSSS